jgi:hypothetical protein
MIYAIPASKTNPSIWHLTEYAIHASETNLSLCAFN